MITIVGGGLAGSEAAWQAASRGVPVRLHEMRPVRPTAVHKTDRLAELVCSNSLRGDKLDNAVGLLKEEMRRLGSLVMRAAEASRVPAGAALAVDRERFAGEITRTLETHPLVTIVREEILAIPPATGRDPVIVATGPLTSEALSADIARMVGAEHLYFYDAISPIVLAESIDRSKVFRASRWNRSFSSRGGRLQADQIRLKPDPTQTGPSSALNVVSGSRVVGNAKATTVDALFGPLVEAETQGSVWTYEDNELKRVPVSLGISDGQTTELIKGDLQPDTPVVTTITTGVEPKKTATAATPSSSPFGGLGGPGGGNRGGFGGGNPGGR
jgi:hypothetical protein